MLLITNEFADRGEPRTNAVVDNSFSADLILVGVVNAAPRDESTYGDLFICEKQHFSETVDVDYLGSTVYKRQES